LRCSVSRPPLLGFAHLGQRFTIQQVPDTSRLPMASTCFNILKLPPYESVALLRERLLLAIRAKAGFEMT
jgi:ubiquitin-protein ligase E3 C